MLLCMATLVDITAEGEVLDNIFLCASDPERAAQSAKMKFEGKGLINPTHTYHINLVTLGQVPMGKVIVPQMVLPSVKE